MEQTAVAVAIITALTQLVKSFIPDKFVRLVPVVFGVLYATGSIGMVSFDVVIYGITLGLGSMGLYDVAHLDTPKVIKAPIVTTVNKVKSMITR